MIYLAGTIADVVEEGETAVLVLDTSHGQQRLGAERRALLDGLTALFGEDWIGKAAAVQTDGATLMSIEIPGAPPNYVI